MEYKRLGTKRKDAGLIIRTQQKPQVNDCGSAFAL